LKLNIIIKTFRCVKNLMRNSLTDLYSCACDRSAWSCHYISCIRFILWLSSFWVSSVD